MKRTGSRAAAGKRPSKVRKLGSQETDGDALDDLAVGGGGQPHLPTAHRSGTLSLDYSYLRSSGLVPIAGRLGGLTV